MDGRFLKSRITQVSPQVAGIHQDTCVPLIISQMRPSENPMRLQLNVQLLRKANSKETRSVVEGMEATFHRGQAVFS